MPSQPPPRLVLDAFGAAGARPVPLGGGQDTPWLAAGLILKPADLDREELAWQARIYSRLSCDGFRLARPVAAAGGSLCVDGWCASEYIAGRHEQRRWAEIIAVGERFHAALRAISRPGFLDHRASPWAISDRVAWGEYPAGDFPQVRHLPRLASALRPVSAPSQIIDAVSHIDDFGQYLIRALIFRAVTDWILAKNEPAAPGLDDPWAPAVGLALQLTAR